MRLNHRVCTLAAIASLAAATAPTAHAEAIGDGGGGPATASPASHVASSHRDSGPTAGAPAASARPAYDPPRAAYETSTRVYSRPDKSRISASHPATEGASTGQAAALRSLSQQQRQRVVSISGLGDTQLAAAVGVAPSLHASVSPAAVRVQTPQSGFDWGDAGIGAAGGVALTILALGGGLLISQRRPRRSRPNEALPN